MPRAIHEIKYPIFQKAVEYLGGTTKASFILGISASNLSYQIRRKNTPPDFEVCEKIERATEGKFTVKKLRPDAARYYK